MSQVARVALTRQLDELLDGVREVDDCPSEALPLLAIAAAVRLDDAEHLPPLSLERGRQQLLAAIAAGPAPEARRPVSLPSWLRRPALAGGLAVALSGTAVAYAAQGAPPGSPLYPVHQAAQLVVGHSVPFLQPATPSPAAVPSWEAPVVAPRSQPPLATPSSQPPTPMPSSTPAAITVPRASIPAQRPINLPPGKPDDGSAGNPSSEHRSQSRPAVAAGQTKDDRDGDSGRPNSAAAAPHQGQAGTANAAAGAAAQHARAPEAHRPATRPTDSRGSHGNGRPASKTNAGS